MEKYTLKELDKETCRSFGGNNCVLHQCMFFCVLQEAKKRAEKRELSTINNNNVLPIKS